VREEIRAVFEKVMHTRDEIGYSTNENEILTRSGERLNIAWSNVLTKDPNGAVVDVTCLGIDLTDRKRAEKERKRLQAQLIQAQKMEAIGTLAGGIAHNFNNTLMGIQGRASLMMFDKDPSDPDYEHLSGIEECVKNAMELNKDLLGFARGGKYEVKPTHLNSLIRHENEMFGRTKKEIRIHGKYEEELWAVEVDQIQIKQALLNLYVNAWQAMPGGGDLYIQTKNVSLGEEDTKPFEIDPGRYVKVSVTDTGVGMDAAIRKKIFDPFFSTKRQGEGSGLGLASLYGIIKNHGGFVNVYSEKGEGTTFNLYLPASKKEVWKEAPQSGIHEIQHGEETVLLVDDENMVLEVGQAMLEKLGYRALTAGSGKEALDLYEQKKDEIDLVILDMIMPGMGGGETYDRLKAIGGDAGVLLSSGYSINGQAQEILDRGCNGFIQKPFAIEALSRKLREVLD
jgi:signal transduction histidine kinase